MSRRAGRAGGTATELRSDPAPQRADAKESA
jgi:hypothetical protein